MQILITKIHFESWELKLKPSNHLFAASMIAFLKIDMSGKGRKERGDRTQDKVSLVCVLCRVAVLVYEKVDVAAAQ